jgi:hypothetical protein
MQMFQGQNLLLVSSLYVDISSASIDLIKKKHQNKSREEQNSSLIQIKRT